MILTDRKRIERLNREFLGHDGPTDVIAFDLRDDEAGPRPTEDTGVVGEIYVCAEVAGEAALRYSTTPAYEIVLYVVHGLLHLAGMDDCCPESRRHMQAAEKRIMSELGAGARLDELLSLEDGPGGVV